MENILRPGDNIVFGRGRRNKALDDVTVGKIYEVATDGFSICFIDDAGDYNYAIENSNLSKPTKIIQFK